MLSIFLGINNTKDNTTGTIKGAKASNLCIVIAGTKL
jgi:hypothetical protein